MADVLDTSCSSDSESSDEEKDNDEYRIECQEECELGISPRKHPRLSSPVSEQYKGYRLRPRKVIPTPPPKKKFGHNPDKSKVLHDNKREQGAKNELCDASVATNGFKIVKRKLAFLMLNGNDIHFCKIETVKYRHGTDKILQHYKKNLLPDEKDIDGNIGLREGDLLIEVNGNQLLNKRQKRVIKIFKNIKPKDKKIDMNLQFRRWEKRKNGSSEHEYEVDYRVKLVLEQESNISQTPEYKSFKYRVIEDKLKETKKTLLPKGDITDIKWKGESDFRIKCMASGPDEYLTVVDGKLVLSVGSNAENEIFTLQKYTGKDKSGEPLSYYLYFVRIQSGGGKFVSSNHKKGDTVSLRASVPRVKLPRDVDETCFIIRKYGNEVVLESLLYRGNCIGSQKEDTITYSLKMVKKSDYDRAHDRNLDDAKFELFKPDTTGDTDSCVVE